MYPQYPQIPYEYPPYQSMPMMYPMMQKPSLLQSMKYSLNQLSMSSTIRTAQKPFILLIKLYPLLIN